MFASHSFCPVVQDCNKIFWICSSKRNRRDWFGKKQKNWKQYRICKCKCASSGLVLRPTKNLSRKWKHFSQQNHRLASDRNLLHRSGWLDALLFCWDSVWGNNKNNASVTQALTVLLHAVFKLHLSHESASSRKVWHHQGDISGAHKTNSGHRTATDKLMFQCFRG